MDSDFIRATLIIYNKQHIELTIGIKWSAHSGTVCKNTVQSIVKSNIFSSSWLQPQSIQRSRKTDSGPCPPLKILADAAANQRRNRSRGEALPSPREHSAHPCALCSMTVATSRPPLALNENDFTLAIRKVAMIG